MKLLITGGAGFIGSNLARLALRHGHEVVILDDFSTGYRHNLDELDVRLIEGSILDPQLVREALKGVDAVTHLAALGSVPRSIANPSATHAVNATGTLTVVEAVRDAGGPHLVVASSSSVYGSNPSMPKRETDWVRPLSPYGVSKLATEQYALSAQQSFGLSTLAFRFFNVYGPRQMPGHAYAAVIPTYLDHLLRAEPLPINGDGSHSRDFTFVGTVCATLLDAAERRVTHPTPVNLAFGTNVSLLELIRTIGEIYGRLPSYFHREPRRGDVPHSQADNAALRSLFPEIAPVPLKEGLTETLRWFTQDLPRVRKTRNY